jgi:hypothetical protein
LIPKVGVIVGVRVIVGVGDPVLVGVSVIVGEIVCVGVAVGSGVGSLQLPESASQTPIINVQDGLQGPPGEVLTQAPEQSQQRRSGGGVIVGVCVCVGVSVLVGVNVGDSVTVGVRVGVALRVGVGEIGGFRAQPEAQVC